MILSVMMVVRRRRMVVTIIAKYYFIHPSLVSIVWIIYSQ